MEGNIKKTTKKKKERKKLTQVIDLALEGHEGVRALPDGVNHITNMAMLRLGKTREKPQPTQLLHPAVRVTSSEFQVHLK